MLQNVDIYKFWAALLPYLPASISAACALLALKYAKRTQELTLNPILQLRLIPEGIGPKNFKIEIKNIALSPAAIAFHVSYEIKILNEKGRLGNIPHNQSKDIQINDEGELLKKGGAIIVEYFNRYNKKIVTKGTFDFDSSLNQVTSIDWVML